MAVASTEQGFLPMTQTAMRFTKVAYHDYEGVAVDLDEQERLVADLGDADLMVLRNHGLLVVGPTIPQAFSNIYRAELACRAQVLAGASGKIILPPADVIAHTNHLYRPEVRRPFGLLEWPALLRKLDRVDPSYRN
jgi:ribulose-5-phosphate 4-epimerase/fuculose-1-phosphate aldolase